MDVAHGCINKLTDGKSCTPASAGAGSKEAAGTRHSKETAEHLQKAHDHLCAAGARCEPAPAEAAAAGEMDRGQAGQQSKGAEGEEEGTEFDPRNQSGEGKGSRPAGLQKRYDALAKAVAELAPRLEQIAADVAAIKRTPLPPLTARSSAGLARIEKGRNGAGEETDAELAARIARMSPDEQALLLIKASRMRPIRIPGVPGTAEAAAAAGG
jgi:hypothetical protein